MNRCSNQCEHYQERKRDMGLCGHPDNHDTVWDKLKAKGELCFRDGKSWREESRNDKNVPG
jgi:hypothetical protein